MQPLRPVLQLLQCTKHKLQHIYETGLDNTDHIDKHWPCNMTYIVCKYSNIHIGIHVCLHGIMLQWWAMVQAWLSLPVAQVTPSIADMNQRPVTPVLVFAVVSNSLSLQQDVYLWDVVGVASGIKGDLLTGYRHRNGAGQEVSVLQLSYSRHA